MILPNGQFIKKYGKDKFLKEFGKNFYIKGRNEYEKFKRN